MTPEQIIAGFLKPPSEGGAYTDEKLAALLAHAEDGKLAYYSCSCLIGVPTANHVLLGENGFCDDGSHYSAYEPNANSQRAEVAFCQLGYSKTDSRHSDEARRSKLIPLIKQEISRRESLRVQVEVSELVTV